MKTVISTLTWLQIMIAVYPFIAAAQSITWQNTNLSYTSEIKSFAFPQPGVVLVGTYSGIIFRSTNNGGNWTPMDTLTGNVRLATNQNGQIFAVVYNTDGGVYRSTDNGVTWTAVSTGLTNLSARCIVINQTTGHIFVRVFDGVFRSTNNGDSWTIANTGMGKQWCTGFVITATGDILAATHGDGIYRSTNDGNTWATVNSGLTDVYVEWLAISPVNDHIFAGTTFSAPFRSTNSGNDWTLMNTGLTTISMTTFAINSCGHIFGGGTNNGGIYRSTNDGDSWGQITMGLTSLSVTALGASPDGYIYAGTQDGYVFRTAEPTTDVRSTDERTIPEKFALFQNYPNPFNPTTTISFTLVKESKVKLGVYNLLGQKVATLVDGNMNAGEKSVVFDAKELSSSVYFYRLEAGNFISQKKMLLMK